jgi:membrane protein YdbS with pleckstrin-like domain
VSWRSLVAAVLRVPPEPQPPPGDVHRTFRASRNFLRYKLVKWGGKQLPTVVGLVVAGLIVIPNIGPEIVAKVLRLLEVIGWALFLLSIPFSLAVVLLDFEMRWYMMTDRSLRIREGIFIVREKTMTFANIQRTTVRQGPLQRLLGIADVEVRSAGGGSGSGHDDEEGKSLVHVGHFRGVDDAERIRDLILEGVRRQRDAGLGDPDDHAPPSLGGGGEAAAALAEAAAAFLSEARLLRETVAGQPSGGVH